MGKWLGDLDRILRGEATRPSALRAGTIELPVGRLGAMIVVLGLVYGFCMGCYALFKGGSAGIQGAARGPSRTFDHPLRPGKADPAHLLGAEPPGDDLFEVARVVGAQYLLVRNRVGDT